jgi:hypothetical protein
VTRIECLATRLPSPSAVSPASPGFRVDLVQNHHRVSPRLSARVNEHEDQDDAMNCAISRQRMKRLEFEREYSPTATKRVDPQEKYDEHRQTCQHGDDEQGVVDHGSSFLAPRNLGAS